MSIKSRLSGTTPIVKNKILFSASKNCTSKIEGVYSNGSPDQANVPTILLLHPGPDSGGTMYNKVIQDAFDLFVSIGFAVLTINFDSSKSSEDNPNSQRLFEAISALRWLTTTHPYASFRWVFGFSFGAYIAAQITMRRPEIDNFILLSPLVSSYDFSFFAPIPVKGLVLHSEEDKICREVEVLRFFDRVDRTKNVFYSRLTSSNEIKVNHFCDKIDFKKTLGIPLYKFVREQCKWKFIRPIEEYEELQAGYEYQDFRALFSEFAESEERFSSLFMDSEFEDEDEILTDELETLEDEEVDINVDLVLNEEEEFETI